MGDVMFPTSVGREVKLPLLSIVATSYATERLKDLCELLRSIKAQVYSPVETIIVIERSLELADKVKQYIQEKSMSNIRVLINQGEPGASAARNLGIKEAKGDIIAFVDDDVVLFPDWAEEMVKAYKSDSIIGVTGSALPLWEDGSMAWLPEEFYWIISCTAWGNWRGATEVRSVFTVNGSYKRDVFDMGEFFSTALGPHDGNKGGWRGLSEEVELSIRAKRRSGKSILYSPKVRVQHKVYRNRLTWRYIAQCAYWIGLSRCILKNLYTDGNGGTNALATEHQLLKHIFTGLLPNILKDFFREPIIAWRKLSITIVVLFFVSLGYFSQSFIAAVRPRKPLKY